MRSLLRWLTFGVFVVTVTSCNATPLTEVLVIFTAEPSVEIMARELVIDVLNQDGETETLRVSLEEGAIGATNFPVALSLVPRAGDATRTFRVHGTLLDETGAPVAYVRLSAGYAEGEIREVRARFTESCLGVLCDESTTCRGGACVGTCAKPVPVGSPPAACDLDETSCDDLHATALFCDGFEDVLPGAWAEANEINGTLSTTAVPLYRGNGSLEASAGIGLGSAYVRTEAVAGIENDLFVRFYAYLPSGQEVPRANLVYAGEEEGNYDGLQIGVEDNGRVFARVSVVDSSMRRNMTSVVTSDRPLAWDKWVCIEAHLHMNTLVGEIELWINDESPSRAVGQNTVPQNPVAGLNFGIPRVENSRDGLTVVMDEVVADTSRIGCD